MANCEIETLHEMVANLNRFIENQTRIMNSLVSQVKDLKERVASCEMSQGNLGNRLDKLAKQDPPPELPPTAIKRSKFFEGNGSPTHFNDVHSPTFEDRVPPIAPRHSCIFSPRVKKESPRSMQRPTNFFEDRRPSLGTRRPVPLPRRINLPRQTEAHSTSSPPSSVRFGETHIMDEPVHPLNISAPLMAPTRVEVSLQESPRSSSFPGSSSSSLSPTLRSPTFRSLPFSGSALSSRSPPPTCPSPPPATRRQQGRIPPRRRRDRPGNRNTQRITERGVRGQIRFFIAGRNFGFVTRKDNGANIFLHRNEVVNIPSDAAINLKEGDQIEFDIMWTDRTPAARNVYLL